MKDFEKDNENLSPAFFSDEKSLEIPKETQDKNQVVVALLVVE